MQLDKISQTRIWFRKASQDLAAARLDLDASVPLIEDALFHCEQAIEKSIKGYLFWHDTPFRKTHDLREISGAAVSIDSSLEPLLRSASPLGIYAVIFRYPGDAGEPSLEEGEEALDLARRVHDEILARLPEEVLP